MLATVEAIPKYFGSSGCTECLRIWGGLYVDAEHSYFGAGLLMLRSFLKQGKLRPASLIFGVVAEWPDIRATNIPALGAMVRT